MDDREAIEMMRRCREEILSLRRQLALVSPKAEAYEAIVAILNLLPQRSVGMTEDLAWRLEEAISELEAKSKPEAKST